MKFALFMQPAAESIQCTEPGVARHGLHAALAQVDDEVIQVGSGYERGRRGTRGSIGLVALNASTPTHTRRESLA